MAVTMKWCEFPWTYYFGLRIFYIQDVEMNVLWRTLIEVTFVVFVCSGVFICALAEATSKCKFDKFLHSISAFKNIKRSIGRIQFGIFSNSEKSVAQKVGHCDFFFSQKSFGGTSIEDI